MNFKKFFFLTFLGIILMMHMAGMICCRRLEKVEVNYEETADKPLEKLGEYEVYDAEYEFPREKLQNKFNEDDCMKLFPKDEIFEQNLMSPDVSIKWSCEVVEDEQKEVNNTVDKQYKMNNTVDNPETAAVCYTNVCYKTASRLLDYMDNTVNPCDDFYQFSCGKFLKNATSNDTKTGDSHDLEENKFKQQLKVIFEEDIESNEIKSLQLPKILYKSCMNEELIEKQGLEPLKEILKELGGWPVLEGEDWKDNNFNWTNIITKHRQIGEIIFYFIELKIGNDEDNNTRSMIQLGQADLGIAGEYLLEGMNDEIVKAYHEYMTEVAVILGANRDNATKELIESLEFEIELLKISQPGEEIHDSTAFKKLMKVSELTETYPNISWLESINYILAPTTLVTEDEMILVRDQSFISKLVELLERTPKRVQANCLLWRNVQRAAPYLNEIIRNKYFKFLSKSEGITERPERWEECVDLVYSKLTLSVSSLYVRKYFDKEAKAAAVDMVNGIKREFKKVLETVDWMDDKTRTGALEMTEFIKVVVEYPDELLQDEKLDEHYRNLELTQESYLQNIYNISRFGIENYLENLKKPVKTSENWKNYAILAEMSASYDPIGKTLRLPAGVWQGSYFGKDRPKYMNYGAIGWFIVHEITHGFLSIVSHYDKEGEFVDWWEQSTKEYLKRAQCVVDQYGNYTVPAVGLKLDGKWTMEKNIADIAGIKMAYQAYQRKNLTEPMLPRLEKYTPQQMFWISAANSRCQKTSPEDLKLIVTNAIYSPDEFRVIGSMSNVPQFAKDFNCPFGSKMNPEKKCSVL